MASVSSGASRQTFIPIKLTKALVLFSLVYEAQLLGHNTFYSCHAPPSYNTDTFLWWSADYFQLHSLQRACFWINRGFFKISVIFINFPGGNSHKNHHVAWNLGSETSSTSCLQCKLVALCVLKFYTHSDVLLRELIHNELSTAAVILR
jgi:hypothetical protein